MTAADQPSWGWWAGSSPEHFHIGPHPTRQEAIDAAVVERIGEFKDEFGNWKIGLHILEAYKDSIDLSLHFEANDWLSLVDEHQLVDDANENGDPLIDVTIEDEEDLQVRVRAAIRDWQAARNIVVEPYTFTKTRNPEYVVVDNPAPEKPF